MIKREEDPIGRHGFIAWFASNPVVANVLLLTILLTGIRTAMTGLEEPVPDAHGDRA